ncbi:hypothetical protein H4S04_007259 [Coemansia sp. S16]|nr:hypothetical protein H4S03_002935 [Coemansia sp. S3946]KAJ2042518.1 hypothetical protein H4S04_007259 [Coemansia sp. S16]
MSREDLKNERHDEMLRVYEERLIVNDSIRQITRPANNELGFLADDIADWIAKDMERFLSPISPNWDKADGSIATRTRSRITNTSTSGAATKHAASGSASLAQDVSNLAISHGKPAQIDAQLAADIGKIKKWTATNGNYQGSEKSMYDPIRSFIVYVARRVKDRLSRSGLSEKVRDECRLILPVEVADYRPVDSDDSTRIDIGLVDTKYDAAIEMRGRASYYQLRSIFEVKTDKEDVAEAFVQLYKYSRQLFAEQHHLRFALGFTICAGDVRLCHFGPSKAVSSDPMDVTTSNGRRAFIQLIVSMSLCDDSQLGRDPTMRYLPALNCWEIDCPDDKYNNGTSRADSSRYYFTKVICVADRLFGRHTRCFLATANRPAKKLKVDESLEATVVIKDAFAFAKPIASDDDRDEVKTLKKIRSTFERNNPDSILYAKIVVGGRVRFKRGSRIVEDTTSTMYAGVDGELLAKVSSDLLFRAHRRIVMDTIGEPLRTVKTAKEFVAVICDAMQCHYAIVDKCKILHRDISDNNILVVRMKDGTVRGLLIDFDCAIDISKEKTEVRGEMTGTFPFMSLNNLTCSTVPRTSLDDWESVLYLLCWHATIGFGTGEDRSEVRARLKNQPIARWRNGTLDTIVDAKRSNLRSLDTFYHDIVRRFDDRDKNSEQLGVFALGLYDSLFANKLGTGYHGSEKEKVNPIMTAFLKRGQHHTPASDDSTSATDPFALRAENWENISKDLLGVINNTKAEMVDWEDSDF